MKLKRIELRNYAQHHELDVEFTGHLISVIGRNGSGKSNFIGAIQFALTGEQPPFNKSDLLSWKQQAGWVKLWFEHHGKECLVQRRIESAGCTLKIGDEEFTGAKKVSEAMRDVLGLDPDILKQSVFVRQTQVESCLFTDPRERELNFQRLLGMGDAAKISKQLGDLITGYGQPESFEESIAEHVEKVEEIRRQLSEIEAVEKEISAKLAGMDEKAVSDEIHGLEGNIKLVEQAISAKAGLERERKAMEAFKKAFPGVNGEMPENPDVEMSKRINETYSKLTWMQVAGKRNSERASLRMNVEKTEEALSKIRPEEAIQSDLKEIERLNEEDARLKAEESQASEFLSKAPNGDVCPLCGSSLGPGHNIKSEIEARISSAREKRAAVRERARALSGVAKEMENLRYYRQRVVDLKSQLDGMGPDEPFDEGEVSRLSEEMGELSRKSEEARREYQSAVNNAAQYNRVATSVKNAENLFCDAMANLADKGVDVDSDDLDFVLGAMRSDLDDAVAKLSAIAEVKTDKAGVEGELTQIRKQLKDFEDMVVKLKRRQEDNDRLRAKLSVLNDVRDWFSYKNGPRVLTQSVMSVLTDSVNSYLDKFGSAFTVEPSSEGMGFLVRFSDGRDMPDQLPDASHLSGGQKIALAVAFRFAVYAIFSNKLGLLSLDEPTAYLDAETIGRFGDLLQKIAQIARNSGLQVLMATHESSLAGVFDQTIQIGD